MTTALKYGVLCGLLTCFWMISEYLMGLHNEHFDIGQYTEAFALLIPAVTVYLALKELRDISPSRATFSRLVGAGIFMISIAGVIIASFFLVYNHHINPSWQQTIFAKQAATFFSSGATIQDMAAAAESYHFYTQDSTQFIIIFGLVFITGLFFSLIYSLKLKRRRFAR